MESNWRWAVWDEGMWGSAWELCARDVDFPTYVWNSQPVEHPGVEAVELNAAFLPQMVWGGFSLPDRGMTRIWEDGWIGDD